MNIITIDCAGFDSPAALHRTFQEALCFPSCYGCNLDALHDCLTDISRETKLQLLHWEAGESLLGRGARRAILDAALENRNLAVVLS